MGSDAHRPGGKDKKELGQEGLGEGARHLTGPTESSPERVWQGVATVRGWDAALRGGGWETARQQRPRMVQSEFPLPRGPADSHQAPSLQKLGNLFSPSQAPPL